LLCWLHPRCVAVTSIATSQGVTRCTMGVSSSQTEWRHTRRMPNPWRHTSCRGGPARSLSPPTNRLSIWSAAVDDT
jgi:hypothetical protein